MLEPECDEREDAQATVTLRGVVSALASQTPRQPGRERAECRGCGQCREGPRGSGRRDSSKELGGGGASVQVPAHGPGGAASERTGGLPAVRVWRTRARGA